VTIDKDPVSGEPVVLGKGRFGKVYRGILLGSEAVAIKCIGGMRQHSSESSTENNGIQDESASDAEGSSGYSRVSPSHAVLESFADMSREEVLKEIRLLKSCHSQYIVSFIGAMFRPHEIRLVTELMPCGDLWNALGHGPCPRTVSWYDGGIFIAMDVAAGLNYLHEKKRVVHLDLKSSNILLRESKREPPAASPTRPAGGAASETGAPCVSRSRSRSRYTGSYLAKVSDVGLSKILPTSHEYLTSMQAGGT
ncbi:MAG: protein kinase, partial [bacterium]|nr:protein kinase [bacterium]